MTIEDGDRPEEEDQAEDMEQPEEMDLTDQVAQPEELDESNPDEDHISERTPGPTWLPMAAVSLVMLAVGMLLGYMGRGQFGPEAQAARATATVQAAAVQTQAAGNQELAKYLASQTRHWKGPEDALVTIIEFSDFQ